MPTRVLWGFIALSLLLLPSVHAATFTVNSASDAPPGPSECSSPAARCTLRGALELANASSDADRIVFDIPATDPGFGDGYWTIQLEARSLAISDSTEIDGTTQAGASCASAPGEAHALKIRVDGNRLPGAPGNPACFLYRGNDSLIRGLAATKCPGAGMYFLGSRNAVECSYLGLTPDGIAAGNLDGVRISGTFNRIGGVSHSHRNVLSNNRQAGVVTVDPTASDNTIEGNYIGTDPVGTAASGNASVGVYASDGHRLTIGGAAPGAGNVISSNTRGIDVGRRGGSDENVAFETVIQGNRIGTDWRGTSALPNTMDGILIVSPDTLVGGSAPGAGNIISGNGSSGVRVESAVKRPRFEGNRIGVGADGRPLGNVHHGIDNSGVVASIGGEGDASNTIAHNGAVGVVVKYDAYPAAWAEILANSIHSNFDLGIDYGPTFGDGVTPNDPQDATNPKAPNYPVLTSVTTGAGGTTIGGTLDSLTSQSFTLRFFSSPAPDPSGYGEGETYLGSGTVTTDATGAVAFSITVPTPITPGHHITATSTKTNGARLTSEFSGSIAAAAAPRPGRSALPITLILLAAMTALAVLLWWFRRRGR